MNTHVIELPPLPYPYNTPAYRTVGALIQKYALAAIKADRKRRGEPVGYINPAHIRQGHGSGIFWKADQNFSTPVYVLPQPAEPVTKTRPETTSEHIARDIREGRFPNKSERQTIPAATKFGEEE